MFVAFNLFTLALAVVTLTLFPACVPSAICQPAAPLSAIEGNWPGIVALGVGLVLSLRLRSSGTPRWSVLEGSGTFGLASGVTGLLLLFPSPIGDVGINGAFALGLLAAALAGAVIARRAARPIRDATVVAAVQLLAILPLTIYALAPAAATGTLGLLFRGTLQSVGVSLGIVVFAAFFRRIFSRRDGRVPR